MEVMQIALQKEIQRGDTMGRMLTAIERPGPWEESGSVASSVGRHKARTTTEPWFKGKMLENTSQSDRINYIVGVFPTSKILESGQLNASMASSQATSR
eukprot:4421351-Amphidinium_carterae.7